jgi:hypothetical protein
MVPKNDAQKGLERAGVGILWHISYLQDGEFSTPLRCVRRHRGGSDSSDKAILKGGTGRS